MQSSIGTSWRITSYIEACEVPDVDPEPGAGVALRVEVDDEDPVAEVGQAGARGSPRWWSCRRRPSGWRPPGSGGAGGRTTTARPSSGAVRRAATGAGRPDRRLLERARRSGRRPRRRAVEVGQVLRARERAAGRRLVRRRALGRRRGREGLQLDVAEGGLVRLGRVSAASHAGARSARRSRRCPRSRWKIARPLVARSSDGSLTAASCPLAGARRKDPARCSTWNPRPRSTCPRPPSGVPRGTPRQNSGRLAGSAVPARVGRRDRPSTWSEDLDDRGAGATGPRPPGPARPARPPASAPRRPSGGSLTTRTPADAAGAGRHTRR